MADNDGPGANKCFKVGLWAAVIAAICCFTPVLVIGSGFVGLAALTRYLDAVLFPMLALLLILAGYGLWQRKRQKS